MLNPTSPAASGSAGAAATRNADADADGAAALIGEIINARLFIYSDQTSDFVRWAAERPSAITGEAQAGRVWARVASALFGRDTSDSTMRSIESRVLSDVDIPITVYAIVTHALLRAIDTSDTTQTNAVYGDLPSAISTGRTASSFRSLWTNALGCRYDVDATPDTVVPTGMSRTVTGSATNPSAAQVIATLDCKALKDKNVWASVAVDGATVRADVSIDNSTWRPLETMIAAATSAGVFLSQAAKENAKAFRYIRVVNVDAEAGGAVVTADISAQGE